MELVMRSPGLSICLLVFGLMMPGHLVAQTNSTEFEIVKTIPIDGGGRWDYVTADPNDHRIYIARSTHVTVMDSESSQVIGDIPDTKGVHGVAVATDLGIGFVSVGEENKVVVFDLKSIRVDASVHIDTGGKPDSIMYYPASHLVFVQNGRGNSSSVIDAVAKRIIATIPLGGAPEFAAYDDSGNVFINLEDAGSIAVVDAANKKLKTTWKIPGCEAPSGLVIDRANHTLFSACTDSKVIAVVSSENGKLLQTLPIGADCDALAFDPSTGYVFASNGDGTLSIFQKGASGKFALVQNLKTPPGSKTMGYNPSTHEVYLPSAKFTGDPTAKPRPSTVPGSIAVLVIRQP